MVGGEVLERLTAMLLEAPTKTQRYDEFCDELRVAIGEASVVLVAITRVRGKEAIELAAQAGLSDKQMNDYLAVLPADPFVSEFAGELGEVVSVSSLEPEIGNGVYGAESSTGWGARVSADIRSVALLRGFDDSFPMREPRRGPALIARVAPHLARSLRTHRKLNELRAQAENLSSLVDSFPEPALLVERSGRILCANKAGSELLRRGDGVCAKQGYLDAIDKQSRLQLSKLLTQPPGAEIALARKGLSRPLLARIRHARDDQIVLFLSPPSLRSAPSASTLAKLFGLTPAEARLAHAIASGVALAEYARDVRISPSTARNQLKSVFDKTSTRRQAELVRLILTAAPSGAVAHGM